MAVDRRTFLRLLGAAAGTVALSACTPDVGEGDAPPADEGPDVLRFSLWGSGAEMAVFQALAREFEAAEGVAVRLEPVSFDRLVDAVDAELQSGRGPDLFRVSYGDLGRFADSGALLDLTPYLPPGYAEQFHPSLWSAIERDGEVLGVPHHLDTSMLLVNTEAAESVGLGPLPARLDEAWTWDELTAALSRFHSATQSHQAATGVNWQQFGAYRWLNFLGQAGGRLLTEELDAPAVNDAAGLEALRYTQSLFTQGLVPPTTSTMGDYVADLFGAGTLATVFAGDFVLPDLVNVAFDYTATFLPVRERATAELGGNAVVATAGTPRAEQAARFLQFLASEEQMARFCEQTTVLPTRAALSGADLDYAVRPDLMELFVQQAEAVTEDIVQQTTVPRFSQINAALVQRLDRAFVGREQPELVLSALSDDIARILSA